MAGVERITIDTRTGEKESRSVIPSGKIEFSDEFPHAIISISCDVFGSGGHLLIGGDFSKLIVAVQKGNEEPQPVNHRGSISFSHGETVWIGTEDSEKTLKVNAQNVGGEVLRTFHRERTD